ncbi:MAG: site-specific integrase [Nannocystaceae bacterium]
MTVKVRPYKRGGWEVDIMLTIPGRPKIRERRRAPVPTKSAAKRWGEERERQLIQHYTNTDPSEDGLDVRPDVAMKEVPTLAQFVPRYIEGHCKANRLRPRTIEQRLQLCKNHLIPAFGRKRLDRIRAEDIQRYKADRAEFMASTLNLHLTLLLCILNMAIEWGVIEKLPVKIKRLKEAKPALKFYDFDELDRLVLAAEQFDHPNPLLAVLLGAEAGLRRGELSGLTWSDIDLKHNTLTVKRQVWRGMEGPPKSGRPRTVPLAPRLRAALQEHRHLRGPNVLWTEYNTRPHGTTVDKWLRRTQKRAGLPDCGPHILRHTFCSHLAMQGAPGRVIQELAGHSSIVVTERYMHLAPTAGRDAVELLARPSDWRHRGDRRRKVTKIK